MQYCHSRFYFLNNHSTILYCNRLLQKGLEKIFPKIKGFVPFLPHPPDNFLFFQENILVVSCCSVTTKITMLHHLELIMGCNAKERKAATALQQQLSGDVNIYHVTTVLNLPFHPN